MTKDAVDGAEIVLSAELYRERFDSGWTFEEYVDDVVEKHRDLWQAVYRRAGLPEEVQGRVQEISSTWKLLALSEDWCGDAVNSLPWVARLAEASPALDLRVISRDGNPEIMDAHLWGGRSRSIPVVILLNEDYEEVDWWGPRPSELQDWVLGEGQSLPTRERYREVRRWYARDGGQAILDEVLAMVPSEVPCGS